MSAPDKRNPSSFQQLEKLGEGTYATVRLLGLFLLYVIDMTRSSKVETDRRVNLSPSKRYTSTLKKAHPAQQSEKSR